MKLVKQKRLYFSEGKSDKVYEVDLLDSGDDLFIVNFRYGRRGSNLREGTKTVFPVPYDEAVRVFNALVLSKEKKGYDENFLQGGATKAVKVEKVAENTARRDTILKYLKQASNGTYTRDWKVSRIIWRAGELNIQSAIPFISQFVNSDDGFEQYAAIYALTKFKNEDYLEDILNQLKKHGFKNKVGRIAASHLLLLGNTTIKEEVKNLSQQSTPKPLRNHDSLLSSLSMYYLNNKDVDASALYYVYINTLGDESARNHLHNFIEEIEIKVNTFKSIRYIYRAAYLLNDMPFFALITKRIAINSAGFISNYIHSNGQWISTEVELKKENPSIAFSPKTRQYFNKHTYKLVYEYSQTKPEKYIEYAKEVLVSLDDTKDNQKAEIQTQYTYDYDLGSFNTETKYFLKYQDFMALNYIVYANAEKLIKQKSAWYFTEESNLADIPRVEAVPHIWNEKPDEVLYILANAKSDIAIDFSLKIIKDNPQFLDAISEQNLELMIGHTNPKVSSMIIGVLKTKYSGTQPDQNIILALLKAENKEVVDLGLQWLKQYELNYFINSEFIASLLNTGQISVMEYLQELYKDETKYNFPLSIAQLEALLAPDNDFDFDYLVAVNQLIANTHFGKLLAEVTVSEIRALANSKSVINRLFAANLAKQNSADTYLIFKESIDNYIDSEEALLRKVGIELLSHFPDSFLLDNHQQIAYYCFSEFGEVREAIKPTVSRLIKLDAEFKAELQNQLLRIIIEPENYEGMHQNSYEILTEYYGTDITGIDKELIYGLILSEYEFAQKLGTPLFYDRITLKDEPIENLVSLSKSHVFGIRESLKDYYYTNADRINYELQEALKVFNSSWKDVIDWAKDFFQEQIKPNNWTVDILLYISDHINPEIQSFARKMINTHFSNEKGLPLLLKLQEHPTKDMQFFITNYLDGYAKDNEEVILKLKDYFKTSLFNINTHRATKTRIYKFLRDESIKNEAVARMTVDIIKDLLDTKTLVDRSNNMDLLIIINEKFPEIESPITINTMT